jgi:hypothetical protein
MTFAFLYLAAALLFIVTVVGIGWPLASRLLLSKTEQALATVVLSISGLFVVAWSIYVMSLPLRALWVIPVVAVGGLLAGRSHILSFWRDRDSQVIAVSQFLISAWCVALLMLVIDYSGGKWVGDWFGHWQRALFFIERWPRDMLFNGFDPVPSRPPLANIITGSLLYLSRNDFAHYQFFSTLLSSLSFLPAALLCRRFTRATLKPSDVPAAIAVLAVVFMMTPLVAQNATFAWTKLPAAFSVLSGMYFFLRSQDPDAPKAAGALCGLSLAAGVLTHYSAVPYALILAVGWCWIGWSQRAKRPWQHCTAIAALTAGLFLLLWFGWAAWTYRLGTLTSNTTVTDQAPSAGAQLGIILLNLRDSLIPHFLGGADFSAFAQTSPWGRWRDWSFQLFQCNFLFMFGSVAWLAVLKIARGQWTLAPAGAVRSFWLFFTLSTVVVGIAVHGGREPGGLAHICLQPLALLGLTWLAASWHTLSRMWRRLLVAGATLDFALGIALQFAIESHALDRWVLPARTWAATAASYSLFAQINARVKPQAGWVFVGDLAQSFQGWTCLGLAIVLLTAVYRVSRFSSATVTLPVTAAS